MKRELTCIVCPLGCKLVVEFVGDTKEIASVTGNTCKRGEEYARRECTHPMRVVTTTMLCDDGEMVPVKTNGAIPKELIFECMKEINAAKATLPIKTGDVLIKNVLGCDVDVVATGNR